MVASSSTTLGSISRPSSISASLMPELRLERICSAICISCSLITSSRNSQIISNRDINAGGRSTSSNIGEISNPACNLWLNLPSRGLAAANTAHRVSIVALIPPFEMCIFCCSIASCIFDLSSLFILSNSSIAASPESARTRIPASKEKRPSLNASLTAAAVKPAPEIPPPEAYFPRGEICDIYVNN